MSKKAVNSPTANQAAAAASRLHSGSMDVDERRQVQARLESDAEFEAEFIHANQALAIVDEWAQELSQNADIIACATKPVTTSRAGVFGAGMKRAAIAASFVLFAAAGFFAIQHNTQPDSEVSRYVTRIGEQKNVELADGTVINLNTNSQVLVEMTDDTRRVVLDRGEVYFAVAKDPVRPFTVELEGRAVSVLGTEFNLLRNEKGFSLALLDGVVMIHRKGADLSGSAPALNVADGQEALKIKADGPRRILPGTVLDFDVLDQTLHARYDPKIERLQYWRKGLLSFEGEPLSKVVDVLARYSKKPLFLDAAGVEHVRVYAILNVEKINQALSDLERTMPVKVVNEVDRIVLIRSQ